MNKLALLMWLLAAPALAVLPTNWVATDIGSPVQAGNTTWDATTATFTVTGGGSAYMSGTADKCQFAYTSVAAPSPASSVTFVARVVSQTDTNPFAKAGISIRTSTATGAATFTIDVRAENGIRSNWRLTDNANIGPSFGNGGAFQAPVWLRIRADINSGNSLTHIYFDRSADGISWTAVDTVTSSSSFTFTYPLLFGLQVASLNDSQTSVGVFDNVTINGVAPDPTATPTPTNTPTFTPTPTNTQTPSNTPTATKTFTPTNTPTDAPRVTVCFLMTATNTPTPAATPTATPPPPDPDICNRKYRNCGDPIYLSQPCTAPRFGSVPCGLTRTNTPTNTPTP